MWDPFGVPQSNVQAAHQPSGVALARDFVVGWRFAGVSDNRCLKRCWSAPFGRLSVVLVFPPGRPVVILVLLSPHDGAVREVQAVIFRVGGVWGPDDFVGDDGWLF